MYYIQVAKIKIAEKFSKLFGGVSEKMCTFAALTR
jgi:hypothetical protein